MASVPSIAVTGVAGVLPDHWLSLTDLASRGLIQSDPQTLTDFGFDRAYIAPGAQADVPILAQRAARAAIADANLQPPDIDVLIWASARPDNHFLANDDSLLAP